MTKLKVWFRGVGKAGEVHVVEISGEKLSILIHSSGAVMIVDYLQKVIAVYPAGTVACVVDPMVVTYG